MHALPQFLRHAREKPTEREALVLTYNKHTFVARRIELMSMVPLHMTQDRDKTTCGGAFAEKLERERDT